MKLCTFYKQIWDWIFHYFLQANLTEVEDGSVKVGEGSGISHTTIGEYHGLLRCLGHFISGVYFNTGTSLLSTCWPAMGTRR